MVGLAFTALQVVTVGAQTGAPGTAPMGDHSGTAPMGDHSGTAPMGDTAPAPSIGERVKSFFGMGTEAPPTGTPGTAPMTGTAAGSNNSDCAVGSAAYNAGTC